MTDQNSLQDLVALAALLADIEKELESDSMDEDDKGRIRELRQHCILQLALLKKAEDTDHN
jgi:hypothetical protein